MFVGLAWAIFPNAMSGYWESFKEEDDIVVTTIDCQTGLYITHEDASLVGTPAFVSNDNPVSNPVAGDNHTKNSNPSTKTNNELILVNSNKSTLRLS